MTLHTIISTVRGGGYGSGAWVAEIVGLSTKFGFERKFLRKTEALSGSGKSGTITWQITAPGVYEYRDVQLPAGQASIGGLSSGFVNVTQAGEVRDLSRQDVIALLSQR